MEDDPITDVLLHNLRTEIRKWMQLDGVPGLAVDGEPGGSHDRGTQRDRLEAWIRENYDITDEMWSDERVQNLINSQKSGKQWKDGASGGWPGIVPGTPTERTERMKEVDRILNLKGGDKNKILALESPPRSPCRLCVPETPPGVWDRNMRFSSPSNDQQADFLETGVNPSQKPLPLNWDEEFGNDDGWGDTEWEQSSLLSGSPRPPPVVTSVGWSFY